LVRDDLDRQLRRATRGSVRGGFPSSVCEQAEVADADQAFGQNVEKKPAQELVC
jgi:hypothetical protein